MKPKTTRQLLYLVLDGLGDEPCAALDGRTPLAVARTPQLDAMARQGRTYLLDMRDRHGQVSTSYGQLALFGYGEDDVLPERGPVEAAGIGVELRSGDIAFRANWATVDSKGRIVDRRAGRIRDGAAELSDALDEMDLGDGVSSIVRSGIEHRVALVLRGPGLGAGVTDSDPMTTVDEPVCPLALRPKDSSDRQARKTAEKLVRFLELMHPILLQHPVNVARIKRGQPPANTLLTRKAGCYVALPTLKERFGIEGLAVVGGSTVLGVMRLLGSKIVRKPGFTANTDSDLKGKFNQALRGLASGHDFVMVHIKAIDVLSHDRKAIEAVGYLEKIDRLLGKIVPQLPSHTVVAVGADHSTSSESGNHITAPPPALVYGPGIKADAMVEFNDLALQGGGAKIVRGSVFFRDILFAMQG